MWSRCKSSYSVIAASRMCVVFYQNRCCDAFEHIYTALSLSIMRPTNEILTSRCVHHISVRHFRLTIYKFGRAGADNDAGDCSLLLYNAHITSILIFGRVTSGSQFGLNQIALDFLYNYCICKIMCFKG